MANFVTSENFEAEVLKSDLPVVVDFYAEWCGPCQKLAPVFDELSKELANKFKLVKVNIDEQRDLAINYNVSSIPTILFIKNGEVKGKETGFIAKEDLVMKMQELLG